MVLFATKKNELLASEEWRKQNEETDRFVRNYLNLPAVKKSEAAILKTYSPDLKQLVIVRLGIGKEPPTMLSLGGKLGNTLQKLEAEEIAILLPERNRRSAPFWNHAQSLVEGLLMGMYRFDRYMTEKTSGSRLDTLLFAGIRTKEFTDSVKLAEIHAESANLARDCSNQPGNFFTPTKFKQECRKVAKETGLHFEALTEPQMKKLKMGCLLGVSQGSKEPAFLNIMRYSAGREKAPTLMLVGKGITFDSGGISLKPPANMGEMKHDMSGGAAVLGAMRIVGLTKPACNVIGLIPAVENLPDGNAIRPGDVLTACNGKTVEIVSTDAEGRLILADALAYGVKRFKPDAVVDIATLTGACMIALGHYNMGMISNNRRVAERLVRAGKAVEEPVWGMPNDRIYQKEIKSKIADLKNAGGRAGGMIHGGQFLEFFIDKTPWAHIDMAGMSNDIKHVDFQPENGATGAGARLLANFVANWKA